MGAGVFWEPLRDSQWVSILESHGFGVVAVFVALLALLALSLLTVAVLAVRLALMRRDLEELDRNLNEWLGTESNVLLGTGSADKAVRRLAASLNVELRRLRRQRQRYLSGDAALKEAVTNVSHDLRTPLTAILGYLDLLEEEDQSEAARRYVSIIRGRAETMKKLTEELFRYAVLLAEEEELKKEPVVVGHVLEESLASFYGVLRQRGIEPEIVIPEQKVVCRCDRAALGRVFSNLLSNGVKYSDGDLRVELREDGRILFSNRAASLSTVDVGRLFDRFYTVEAARSSSGLGLSIARTLTERMGGQIDAVYKEGRLTITVQLPLWNPSCHSLLNRSFLPTK